ncbi:hypothetical protein IIE18_03580 [Pseudomonas sp. V1]|uniref:hypothetical protein n=1 Tax=Pseudomonas arcuscaelestis TaxID=2710591 RepID=UPI00193F1082|nr:hypothetical protein [Pseudomonas arcuscaelestis]MBM3104197.1 hypothetical protein [Pseudomonas arcuscaelestis]
MNAQPLQQRICKVLSALTLCSTAVVANAAQWSDTFVGFRYGEHYSEPPVDKKIQKEIYQLGHSSGNEWGANFFNLDVLKSDSNDPKKDSDSGAVEAYLVYRHQVFLSKVFDRSLRYGPIKDIALTGGIELNYKNNDFSTRKRQLLIGPTLKFDVPGYLDLSLLYSMEWNHCGLSACKTENIEFDPYYVIHLAWGYPFQLGEAAWKFHGFASYKTAKGKDYFNDDTGEESLIRGALMVDVGKLAWGTANTLWVGPGYEWWHHKYGAMHKPGVNTHAPTLHMEWHF